MATINRSNLKSVISEESRKAAEYWQKASKSYPAHKDLYDFYAKIDQLTIKYCNIFRADCDGMEPDDVWRLAFEAVNDLTADFAQSGLNEEYDKEWQNGVNFTYKILQKEKKRAEEGNQAFTAKDIRGGNFDD